MNKLIKTLLGSIALLTWCTGLAAQTTEIKSEKATIQLEVVSEVEGGACHVHLAPKASIPHFFAVWPGWAFIDILLADFGGRARGEARPVEGDACFDTDGLVGGQVFRNFSLLFEDYCFMVFWKALFSL